MTSAPSWHHTATSDTGSADQMRQPLAVAKLAAERIYCWQISKEVVSFQYLMQLFCDVTLRSKVSTRLCIGSIFNQLQRSNLEVEPSFAHHAITQRFLVFGSSGVLAAVATSGLRSLNLLHMLTAAHALWCHSSSKQAFPSDSMPCNMIKGKSILLLHDLSPKKLYASETPHTA